MRETVPLGDLKFMREVPLCPLFLGPLSEVLLYTSTGCEDL